MTNIVRALRLLAEAYQVDREMDGLIASGAWNLVVRRAQEAVELALKAVLLWLGVDFPKSHDVGGLVARVATQRGVVVEPDFLAWLEELSTELAFKRAPSFYCEAEYSEEDAMPAREGAAKILAWARTLVRAPEGPAPTASS